MIPCISYCRYKGRVLTIPQDTKAFLYCFTSPKRPRIATELRLRVVPSDDPASFENGSDLLKSNGLPWSRSLFVLSRCFIPLYKKLREEQFVSDDLQEVLSTFPPIALARSQLLFTLNDAFTIDFGSYDTFFYVITEQGMQTVRFYQPFFDKREISRGIPYTGAYTNHHILILLD